MKDVSNYNDTQGRDIIYYVRTFCKKRMSLTIN